MIFPLIGFSQELILNLMTTYDGMKEIRANINYGFLHKFLIEFMSIFLPSVFKKLL